MFKEFISEVPVECTSLTEVSPSDQEFELKKQLEQFVVEILKNTPDEKYLMEGTGFNVAGNIAQYIYANKTGDLEYYLDQTHKDLEGYVKEFLLRLGALPYKLSCDEIEGKLKMCVYDEENRRKIPLTSILDPRERDGAVLRRTQLLETLIPNAEPYSMFVITSPDGWHGLNEEYYLYGSGYLESQTGIITVGENKVLNAVTIRTSMSLSENERLLQRLSHGQYIPKTESERERIVDVVDTVVQTSLSSPEDITRVIASIMGTDTAWIDRDKNGNILQNLTFDDLVHQLHNVDSFEVQNLIAHVSPEMNAFTQFMRDQQQEITPETIRQSAVKLGDTLGRMSYLLRSVSSARGMTQGKSRYHFDSERTYQQSLGGCNETVFGEMGRRSVGNVEYAFDKKGICRAGMKCETPLMTTMLGPCDICAICDQKIRDGILHLDGTEYRPIDVDYEVQPEETGAEIEGRALVGQMALWMFSLIGA